MKRQKIREVSTYLILMFVEKGHRARQQRKKVAGEGVCEVGVGL